MNTENRQKKNNKGFTLVEVLVAMAIMTLIVAPLLSTFVVASRTNAKSRRIMQATTVAQNTMEAFKAYSLENAARNINGFSVDEDNQAITCSISSLAASCFEAKYDATTGYVQTNANKELDGTVTKGTVPASVMPVYETVSSVETLKGVKFLGQVDASGDSKYQFVFSGMSVQSSGNLYDEVVTVEADNTTAIANITSMNQEDCAYYVESSSEAETNATEFHKRYLTYLGITDTADTSVVDPGFADIMTRSMTVTIDGGITTVDSTYDCGAGYTSDADRTISESHIIYNELVSGTDLSAVYIYYYPLYGVVRDDFKIVNKSGKEVTVYFIKMLKSGSYNATNEASYRTSFTIQDLDSLGAAASSTLTKICTNVTNAQLFNVDFNTVTSGDEKALIDNLGNSSNEYVKYDVTIEVYEHDDDNFTVTGGLQAFDTTDAVKLTTFTGSFTDDSEIDE